MRRWLRVLSWLAISVGIGLLLSGGGLYAYGGYERYRFEQTPVVQVLDDTTVVENLSRYRFGRTVAGQSGNCCLEYASSSSDTNSFEQTSATGAPGGADPDASLTEANETAPSSDEQVPVIGITAAELDGPSSAGPKPGKARRTPPATWILIPAIEVDSPVVEAPIENGQWQVPKFVVGHLKGTANPGEVGNAVLTGHVESIASGNVFGRLKEMSIGDDVTLLAAEDIFNYTVKEIKVVKNDDISVVQPIAEPILTLIVCTGTWNPIIRDYNERLIVIARP